MADVDAKLAVEGIIKGFLAAWNAHDARAFAAIFAEDADFTNVFGMQSRGRAEIEAWHAKLFATMFKDSQVSVTAARMRLIRPDVAGADIRWEMTGARDPQGHEWPKRRGLINLTASVRGGRWLVEVFHNMDLPQSELTQDFTKLAKE